jgi:hypothetical protein
VTVDSSTADLLGTLQDLQEAVRDLHLPLQGPDVVQARDRQAYVLHQLEDYVLPRLEALDAPVLAVVGGSTGAGKSTLVNSLAGEVVSRTGVLRPTTRAPVLVHHPSDERWFTGSRILPSLPRVTGGDGEPGTLRLVASDRLGPGLALLDAPDIDSVVVANRELAAQLLAAADLWLFVTTAARYADAVPWSFLRDAAARGAAVAVVLDRVPCEARAEISAHLASMLADHHVSAAQLFEVAETELTAYGLLPPDEVEPVQSWLTALAGDAAARATVVRQTLAGSVSALAAHVDSLASAADAQAQAVARLRQAASEPYARALDDVMASTKDGTLLRGEVLARWQDFVGTGEFFRSLEAAVGRWRDRLVAAIRGEAQPVTEMEQALETGLESLILDQADTASAAAARAWRGDPFGAHHVPPGADRSAPGLRDRTAATIRGWQSAVLDLVRREGQARRTTARYLSFGVNGVAVALMVVVFASTGGVTGAEVGIAGGTAIVSQRVLEAIFGDEAVRRLAELARQDLRTRIQELYAQEAGRYATALDRLPVDPAAGATLRRLAAAVRVEPVRTARRQ